MSANEPRIRNLIRAIIVGVFLLVMPSSEWLVPAAEANEAFTKKLDMPDSPEELPYLLHTVISARDWLYASPAFVDIDNDNRWELFHIVNELKDSSFYDSHVVTFKNFIVGDIQWRYQYNSPRYRNHKIMGYDFVDVVDDPTKDLILSKCVGDTLLLEIVGLDSSCFGTSVHYIKAAVGKSKSGPVRWGTTYISALLGIDLNGDGAKELIYSRLAQPDSAIERGIVAYDLKNQRQIWFYPTADMVSGGNFYAISKSDGSCCFVFATKASGNRYASNNGMNSQAAYCAAIDLAGHELWRKEIGSSGFCPTTDTLDLNNDGVAEFLIGNDNRDTVSNAGLRIRAIKPFTGDEIIVSDDLHGQLVQNLLGVTDPESNNKFVYATVYDNLQHSIYELDKNLKILGKIDGYFPGPMAAGHLIPQEGLQVITPISLRGESMMGVFNSNFDLLAYAPAAGNPSISYDKSGKRFVIVQAANGYNVFTLEKQNFITLIYARYKWWLAVMISGFLVWSIILGIRFFVLLYSRASGLPGLDKINALVMILNNKGKIVYINSNLLKEKLLGFDAHRGIFYDNTELKRFPDLIDFIRKSYLETHKPIEGNYELKLSDDNIKILTTIYPSYGKQNNLIGKIVFMEDVTAKTSWERRAVIGDAAQRWIHHIKGNMGTARIILENLGEDNSTREVLDQYPEIKRNLNLVKKQVIETAETSDKILHFARITKPELICYDLNKIVETAIERYLSSLPQNVVVTKMQLDGLPLINIDHLQIVEVLENLISNALKSLNGGGKITISTDLAGDLLNNKRMVKLSVEDTGCGISEEDQQKIFLPGFSKNVNGSGIGLAIVKEIVENHKGKIMVESEIDKGSKFTILLPLE